MNEEMRVCRVCGVEKSTDDFRRSGVMRMNCYDCLRMENINRNRLQRQLAQQQQLLRLRHPM